MSSEVFVSASILAADFGVLREEVAKVSEAGAHMLHFDVMDGHFVPNITFGAPLIKALRPHSKLIFDTHLMISNPERYIESFAEAGSDYITVHAESATHLERLIAQIKDTGKKAGVSLVPSTHEDVLKYVISEVDLILVMTVNPGFCGQRFINSQLWKVSAIRRMLDEAGSSALLSVDGGVNNVTAPLCVSAGANTLVSGSYIFESADYKASCARLLTSAS